MSGTITTTYAALKAWGKISRRPILNIAAIAFIIGIILSIRNLGFGFDNIYLLPLIIIVFILAPISALFNGLELTLCARALQRSVPYKNMLAVSTAATVANILPLPAGLLMRGGALVNSGASVKQTGKILLLAGLMWICMAATVSALALTSGPLQGVFGVAGLVSTLIVAGLIRRMSSMKIAVGFVAVRAIMICILVIQLKAAFAAIDQSISLGQSAIYVVSGISAAIVSIVPAGLGLIEGTGAVLAEIAGASPSAAFLALGLNRILSLIVTGTLAWFLYSYRLDTAPKVQ